MEAELFTRTIDHRLVFTLFEFLLAGVIALVVLKTGRRAGKGSIGDHWCLLCASFLLSLALSYSVYWAGARFLLQSPLPEVPFLAASHISLLGAWIFLGLQFRPRLMRNRSRIWVFFFSFIGLSVMPIALLPWATSLTASFEFLTAALDVALLAMLAVGIGMIVTGNPPARRIWLAGLCLLWLSGFAHWINPEMGSASTPPAQQLLWNLEQFFFLAGLFVLSWAIGEWSTNLFDIVFIRIQIAFMMLAFLILIVIIRTDRSEYLTELKARCQGLEGFVAAGLEMTPSGPATLSSVLNRGDLMGRIIKDFGTVQELSAMRIETNEETALIAIDENGEVTKTLEAASSQSALPKGGASQTDFLIDSVPFRWKSQPVGRLELYGAEQDFHRYIQGRVILIFSLFTVGVALATLMVGLVVSYAEHTLRRQEEEIRAKRRELQMASKLAMLGELAGSVAHEVNNPAATIMSRASFLSEKWSGKGLPEADIEDMGTIVEQARRIAQITNSLLGFSRRHVFELKPTDICQVIQKSIDLVEEELTAHAIEVQVAGCREPSTVWGDRNSLVQVFVNLLQNSMAAMPGPGRIRIELTRNDSGSMAIRFSDTGVGVSAENLSRVFVPFFTTKELGKGTGLGLSVVYGIVSEHKGSIQVESQENQGTTFHIELPGKA